jgi:DNA repair exonuclease SbcCD ATPase subunit
MMNATEVTAKRMNMTEIIKKAKTIGIDPERMEKAELIRSIQTAEGCTACFGTLGEQCAYAECCFMQDCFKISLAEHKQTEEHLKRQIGELTAANEQLQQEITERQQAEDDMEQYCNRLGQRIEEQTIELTSANDKLQHQTTKRQRLEQCLVQLQAKLDNIKSIIKKQLELREVRPEVFESSTFASASLSCEYN